MRRTLALLTAGLLLCLTGCQSKSVQGEERLKIVATVFPQYDFARTIAGDYADVTLLLAAGQEMHNYEPTPMDVAEISDSDIFLRIGGESEVWTDTLLDALDTADMQVITLMEYIDEPLEEAHDHHHHDHGAHEHEEEEEAHGEFDEHIWNSPVNAIAMVQAVRDALCEADPAHAEEFRERAAAYISELEKIDAQYRALADTCEEPMLIVADKFPFRYLTAEYGFAYSAAFSGCSSETEPTIASLYTLVEETEHHGIETVFHLEFSSPKIANLISEMTGADTAMLRPGHNISAEDLEKGVTFLDLTRENYEVIKEALT